MSAAHSMPAPDRGGLAGRSGGVAARTALRPGEPLLRVEDLVKHYPVTAGVFGRTVGHVKAVDGISFELAHGETLGLVGESGCGKTTAGRSILRLERPTSGRVLFEGVDLGALPARALRPYRREMQIIFQDPVSSLNPRRTVLDIVGEALEVHGLARGADVERRVTGLLERVGLPAAWRHRYPHEFSGGQRQRIGIARAIALEPKLIVCDEAVSALDVSIRAQVLNVLARLRREMDLAYLFIAHDLAVVRHISHRVAVMYLGKIVESAPTAELFARPVHPYTRALLSAVPVPDPRRRSERIVLTGDVPSPIHPPRGCRFHTRCPAAWERCRVEEPAPVDLGDGHRVACFLAHDVELGPGWPERIARRTDEAIADRRRCGESTHMRVEDGAGAEPGRAPGASSAPESGLAGERASAVPAAAPGLGPARAGSFAPQAAPYPEAEGARVREDGAAEPGEAATGPFGPGRRVRSDTGRRRKAGAALVGLGGIVMVLASAWLGALLAISAHLGLLRPSVRSRRAAAAALVGVLLAGGAGHALVAQQAARAEARRQHAELTRQIRAYTAATGQAPASLDALGWRLYEVFERGRPRDPWGRAWRYRAPGSEGRPFELGSFGPDGRPGGGDDVGRPPRAAG